MTVPLGPQRLLLVGEVERVDDLAALPPAITGRIRPNAGIRVVRNVTQPRAIRVECVDVEGQRARP